MEHSQKPGQREKKRRGGRGRMLAGAALAIALPGGAGLGLGGGLGQPDALPAIAPMASEAPAQAQTPAPTLQQAARIVVVRESSILHGEETLSLEALRERLLSVHQEGDVWELVDAHAKKGPYDQVRALLQELGLPFTEAAQ